MRSRAQAVIQLRCIEHRTERPVEPVRVARTRPDARRRARHRASIAPPDKRTGATAFSARCRLTEADLHPITFKLNVAGDVNGDGYQDVMWSGNSYDAGYTPDGTCENVIAGVEGMGAFVELGPVVAEKDHVAWLTSSIDADVPAPEYMRITDLGDSVRYQRFLPVQKTETPAAAPVSQRMHRV